jgi:two-component system cell cycle sensor histidine kinase/response regulator CckA
MVKLVRRGRQVTERPEPASIVEPFHDAIIGTTRQGIVTSWNPAATRLYGYTCEEIIGHDVTVLYPPERRAEEAEVLRRIVSGEERGQFRTDRSHKDGTLIEVSLTASPIVDPAGTIVGAATVSRRFTELQDARDRFEARVSEDRGEAEDARDRFEARVSEDRGEAEDARDQFEARVDGYRVKAQDAQDQFEARVDGYRVKAQDAQDQFEAAVTDVRVKAQDAQDRFEVGVSKERGEAEDARDRFEARVSADRVQTQDAQDRFEEQQGNERLEAQRDRGHIEAQLQQAQRLENLGQLAGGVAHDFNNLLAVILNYAAFVTEELDAATESDCAQHCRAARDDVVQIKRAAQRATDLTHQLLAFARREVVRPQVLYVNTVITSVEGMLRRTLGEHVQLVTSLAGDLWPVLADPGQLEQVLVNLAVNARDAMPGGGTLTIDTGNVTVDADAIAGGSRARRGRNVRLRVSDTGTGMAADVIEHAFEPFFTTKPEGAGTGLGLATVYGILTQADGQIRIYSEPGTGTTFTITLPVTDQAVIHVTEPPPYLRSPTGETVLVVEDEEALREVTRRIFARNGYHVLTAADGPQALAIAGQHEGEIHLLVTDVVMPQMLGKDVADKMTAIKPGLAVLYMSGYARPVLASQGRLDPGVALVEKPFSEAELLAMAGRVLNGNFLGFTTVQGNPPA